MSELCENVVVISSRDGSSGQNETRSRALLFLLHCPNMASSALSRSVRGFCTCSARLQAATAQESTTLKPRRSTKPVSSSSSFKEPTKPNPRKKRPSTAKETMQAKLPQTELFQGLRGTSPIAHRPTLVNEDSARDLVREWGIDKMHDVTVLEVYPGELSHDCWYML